MIHEQNRISKIKYFILVLTLIFSGAMYCITFKLVSTQYSLGERFIHVWVVTWVQYLGQAAVLIFYYIYVYVKNNREKKLNITKSNLPELSPFRLITIAMLQLIGDILGYISISMMSGSIHTMLSNSVFIFSAIFSKIILKAKYYRHNYLAFILVLIGLISIFLGNLYFLDPKCVSENNSNSFTGIIILLLARIVYGFLYVRIEKYSKDYQFNPLKSVGWQGVWGLLFSSIMLVVFQYVPCGESDIEKTICCKSEFSNKYFLENIPYAIRQIKENGLLQIYLLLLLVSTPLFDIAIESIAMYSSTISRIIISNLSTIIVWGFFMLPIFEGCSRENFKVLQLVGFVLLIFSSIINSEVLILTCCGFSKYTKNNLFKEEVLEYMSETKKLSNYKNKIKLEFIKTQKSGNDFNNNKNSIDKKGISNVYKENNTVIELENIYKIEIIEYEKNNQYTNNVLYSESVFKSPTNCNLNIQSENSFNNPSDENIIHNQVSNNENIQKNDKTKFENLLADKIILNKIANLRRNSRRNSLVFY